MKKNANIFKILLILGSFFIFSNSILGQKNILELLPGAEKLIYNEETQTQRLIGNVNFKYQGSIMYCDSAYFYTKTNEVKAYGKVHINRNDTLNLYCDSLYYNGKTKFAKLWGHVRVRDREYKITTDSMDYNAKLGQGVYRHGGKIESILTNEILTSKVGYFYPDSKNFFFSGKVVYKSPDILMTTDTLKYNYLAKRVYFFGPTKIRTKENELFCEKGWYNVENQEGVLQKNAKIINNSKIILGDSIYHNPTKGLSIGKGNIYYKDTLDAFELKGNSLYKNDKDKKAYLTGKALCIYKLKDDTLFLHADTLFAFQDSLNNFNLVKGYKKSKFFKRNLSGICDSFVYNKQENFIELHKKPIIWTQNAELKGEFMKAYLKDSVLEYIEILEKSSVVAELDSGNYYNQIAGKNIKAYFTNNELTKVKVETNSQTIYFPEEKTENDTIYEIKRKGMNRIYAGNLTIALDSGEVTRISYLDKPDAVFYPLDQINKEEQFIPYFSWNPLLRPKKIEELFL